MKESCVSTDLVAVFSQQTNRIIEAMRQSGVVDTGVVSGTFRLAKSILAEMPAETGGQHIIRCAAAAHILAGLGVECAVIAASVYLGLIKENRPFSDENHLEYSLSQVSDLAECVLVLEAKYQTALAALSKDKFALEGLAAYVKTDRRGCSALLIKAAECLAYFSALTVSDMKAEETAFNYMPLFQELQLNYFIDRINDQLFRLTEPALYHAFSESYEKLFRQNEKQIAAFKTIIDAGFLTGNKDSRGDGFSVKPDDIKTEIRKFIPHEVYRLVNKKAGGALPSARLVSKYVMPVCEINIIIDTGIDGYDGGFHKVAMIYKELLTRILKATIPKGYVLTKYETDRYNRFIASIKDKYNNTVRLCFAHKKVYLHYLFCESKEIPVPAKPVRMQDDSNTIVVYKRNGNPFIIDKGATVLDAAFAIGAEIGITAKAALVNGQQAALYDVLYDRDHVEIIADMERKNGSLVRFIPHVRIAWLEHVVTRSAKHTIIKLLENQYGSRHMEKMKELICQVSRSGHAVIYRGYAERQYAEENGVTHLTVIIAAYIADGEQKGKLIVHNRHDKQIAKGLACPPFSYNLFGGHCNPPKEGDADLIGKEVAPAFLMQTALRELSEEMLILSTIDDAEAIKIEDRRDSVTNILYAKPFPVAESDLIPIGFTDYHRESESEISYLYALPVNSRQLSSMIAADDCVNDDGTRSTIALPVSLKAESELHALFTENKTDTEICNAIARLWENRNETVYHKLMELLRS